MNRVWIGKGDNPYSLNDVSKSHDSISLGPYLVLGSPLDRAYIIAEEPFVFPQLAGHSRAMVGIFTDHPRGFLPVSSCQIAA